MGEIFYVYQHTNNKMQIVGMQTVEEIPSPRLINNINSINIIYKNMFMIFSKIFP